MSLDGAGSSKSQTPSQFRTNSSSLSGVKAAQLRQTSATVPTLLEMARKTSIARHGL